MPLEFSKAFDDDEPSPTDTNGDRPRAREGSKGGAPGPRSIYEVALDRGEEGGPTERPVRSGRRRRPRSEAPARPQGEEEPRPKGDADGADERPRKRRGRRRRERRKDGEAERAKQRSERLAEAGPEDVADDAHYGGAFREFGLSGPILKAIEEMGWEDPSEIQLQLIPKVLMGRDMVGQARTGTGKTGAFAVPLIERYRERAGEGKHGRLPKVLILSPTRELAVQIDDQLQQLAAYTDLRCVCVYGGAPLEPQLRALRAGADIVSGTPGRVMDHIRRGTLKLDEVSCFVLDEADRMFDLGFRDDIYWIGRRLPEEGRQTLLLSATVPEEVLKLAEEVTKDPEVIRTASKDLTVKTVEQFYVAVDPERKLELLLHLVEDEDPTKGIVFTRTKRGADRVAQRLRGRGVDAGEIHGDLRQKRREAVLKRFREGNLHVLVATDVAARGLDIKAVSHIFNFDVPENPEDYVHRVGRTARMGQSGRAFTFITSDDGGFLTEIEKLINKEVPAFEVEGVRTEATDEEKAKRVGRRPPPETHPMASKLSPALMSILNQRQKARGPRARGPGPRGGKGADRKAAQRGGGRGKGGGRGRGGR